MNKIKRQLRVICEIILHCKVKPLARPRAGKHHFYQPKKNQRDLTREMFYHRRKTPINEPVLIDTEIYFEKPKRAKHDYPIGRCYGDEDNLRKAIMDALVGPVLTDDSIVLGGSNIKLFNDANFCRVKIYAIN